ncbi:MAG: uroporphyrinogen-III synthase [Beutenbergiaceae bacterium]
MSVVLVPKGGAWGAAVAVRAVEAGLVPWVLPLIETVPTPSATLIRARTRLVSRHYQWLVVTSAAAVSALGIVPRSVRVAAVGQATARALQDAGISVELVGQGGAAALLRSWPQSSGGRVLAVQSDRAKPVLAQGLRQRGFDVETVVAYRTAPVDLSPPQEQAVRDGKADVALLTSGTIARRLAQIPVSPATRLVAFGPQTAQDARDAGLQPISVAARPTVAALLEAAQEVA